MFERSKYLLTKVSIEANFQVQDILDENPKVFLPYKISILFLISKLLPDIFLEMDFHPKNGGGMSNNFQFFK